jgi:hypothetical protein
MKSKILIGFGLCMLGFKVNAHDSLFVKDGSIEAVRINTIFEKEIRYHKFNNLNGPEYHIDKAKVFKVKFANGTSEIFNAEENYFQEGNVPQTFRLDSTSNKSSYFKGVSNAQFYYHGKKSGKGAVGWVAGLAYPILGLIPLVPVVLSKPQYPSLNVPNPEPYRNNVEYAKAYKAEATKIKLKKVFGSYLRGSAVSLLFILLGKQMFSGVSYTR